MAVKLLWYLTSPDGPYPWLESGRWDTDYEHLQQIAITADRLGLMCAEKTGGFNLVN